MSTDEHMERHIGDVRRLVAICALRGVSISEREAYEAWSAYSDTSAAGWLPLEVDDDLLFSTVESYAPARPASP